MCTVRRVLKSVLNFINENVKKKPSTRWKGSFWNFNGQITVKTVTNVDISIR